MIKAEYIRFLQTLNADDIDVHKIANIILKNLDTLIPLSTAKGQRIIKMVKLAQKSWGSVSPEIHISSEHVTEQTCPIKQLKRLSVGSFRGFVKQEDFDLASELVLIYGPNGTGKSSFCEALEYGLLGNVVEAESKRFRNQQDYLKNAYTNKFIPPILVGVDSQGNDISITQNEHFYRFCFVEKNRIDNFSRIAAQAPAKQTELISTLFGLDAFAEFVLNFTDAMDDRYIDLHGIKAKELLNKQVALTVYQEQLKNTIPEEIQNIENEEKELAQKYREGCVYSQMVAELNGTADKMGLIKQIENELQKQLPTKSNLTIISLESLIYSIKNAVEELKTKQVNLLEVSQEVSFKKLYEAVKQLKEGSFEKCPACQTELAQVKVNPFDYADAELKKLDYLSHLQDELKALERDIALSLNNLSGIINTCCSRPLDTTNPLLAMQIIDEQETTIDWWNNLIQKSDDGFSLLKHLEIQVKQFEDIDKETETATTIRLKKQTELNRLREFKEEVVKLKTRRETTNITKNKAEEAIAKFDTENAQLISIVFEEKAIVAQNQAIANAYAIFVQKLEKYKNELPAQLVANLGETVVQLYNAFNRNDNEHEQLANIALPLSQNQRLRISFKKNPNKYFDALHILSEGHIRCVGLAILTAKNIKENCPILIFDDPVNAIDDEHRQSIRETLFIDNYFAGKQLIIAIHGEEFFNRTHQIIGNEAARQAKSYLFSYRKDYHISVNSMKRPKNYVLAARELYDASEYRDSLMSARRALESLLDKTWYHYGKYCDKSDALISVSRRSPDQPWDLRCLAENLKSKFNKSKADIPNKNQIVTSIKNILGTDAKQPPWLYLNKGTHDETDLPEFDDRTVSQIVESIELLDISLINV
jgi:DNA sulfur modification protein DndD